MRGKRFLVIIAHPEHGRIARLRVPAAVLHLAGGAVVAAAVAAVGLSGSFVRQAAENERLGAENSALQQEYGSLLLTVEERDEQLKSLSDMAYQVSVAYGIRRDAGEEAEAYGTDLEPAYYSSLGQYDSITAALVEPGAGVPMQSLLANTTPSIWPVRGHITSTYGKRQDPFNGKGSFHPGIDISAPYAAPVVASGDGYVISAEWEGALGHCVKIAHGRSGFRTIYGHLKEYFVRPGQSVRRGEVIGLVGRSGRTTGKHLHYEVHLNRMNVNPYRYLRNRERQYRTSLAD